MSAPRMLRPIIHRNWMHSPIAHPWRQSYPQQVVSENIAYREHYLFHPTLWPIVPHLLNIARADFLQKTSHLERVLYFPHSAEPCFIARWNVLDSLDRSERSICLRSWNLEPSPWSARFSVPEPEPNEVCPELRVPFQNDAITVKVWGKMSTGAGQYTDNLIGLVADLVNHYGSPTLTLQGGKQDYLYIKQLSRLTI